MSLDNLTVVLLAGDPKCLKLIPPAQAESYLERAVRAVRSLGCSILLVHHHDVNILEGSTSIRRVPAGEKLFDSVAAGLAAGRTEYLMVLATDLPLVEGAALREFFQLACLAEADVVIALARLVACRELGYGTRHPIPLAGEQYKFGSAFVIRRAARERTLAAIKEMLELRKQPIRLVQKFLSGRFLVSTIRFILSHLLIKLSLTFADAERLVAEQVGVQARAVVAHPSLAIDDD